jgi:hypothetical protein
MSKKLTASEIADWLEDASRTFRALHGDAAGVYREAVQKIRENLIGDSDGSQSSLGVDLIAAERERQIAVEGFSSNRDDNYTNEELASAASFYAMPQPKRHLDLMRWLWPWHFTWWKPSPDNRIRELAKAGALIAAEIDRLKRQESLNR